MKDLIIQSTGDSMPLSKSAQKFNTLLKKLEKAENNLVETRTLLDHKLIESLEIVQPAFNSWTQTKIQIIQSIADYLSTHKFSEKQIEYIISYCHELAKEIRMSPYQPKDNEQQEIVAALSTIDPEFGDDTSSIFDKATKPKSYEEQRAEALAATIEMIYLQMEMAGLEIDLSDLHASMSDEEITTIIEERIAAIDPTFNPQNKKQKKKSKAQVKKEKENEKFNEMKDKSFSSMYKNLVKLIHPDGEIDAAIRERKTEWMKQLTVAYKNKDIKTLMMIELEWLSGAREGLEKMSEEKLEHFNRLLNDQIKETAIQEEMMYHESRYTPLLYFAQGPSNIKTFQPKVCRNQIVRDQTQDETILNSIKSSPSSAKAVFKQIVKEIKEQEKDDEFWMDDVY